MTFNPKAPPVYKPTSQKVAAPPIYRPQQANHSSAQLKPAANFRTETRPAPPVYRPEQWAVQPKRAGLLLTDGGIIRRRLGPPRTMTAQMKPHESALSQNHRLPTVIQRSSRGTSWRVTGGEFKDAFLAYAKTAAPVTEDTRTDDDQLAEMIVPSNDSNCAAIVRFMRGSKPFEHYIIAYATNDNNPAPTSNKISGVSSDMWDFFDIERVDNPSRIHCELALFENFGSKYYIGISKKCCLLCQLALSAAGFTQNTRGCHGATYSTGWPIPSWLKESEAMLGKFLGPDAYGLYSNLGQMGQIEALTWIQGGCKGVA